PARKGAVRTVVPPVIVAVGLERAVVVERPFAVGVSEAVDERTAEAAVAPDVAAPTVHRLKLCGDGRTPRNPCEPAAGTTMLPTSCAEAGAVENASAAPNSAA